MNAEVEQDPNGMVYVYMYPGYAVHKIKKQVEVFCIVDLDENDVALGFEIFGDNAWKIKAAPKVRR